MIELVVTTCKKNANIIIIYFCKSYFFFVSKRLSSLCNVRCKTYGRDPMYSKWGIRRTLTEYMHQTKRDEKCKESTALKLLREIKKKNNNVTWVSILYFKIGYHTLKRQTNFIDLVM